MPDWKKIRRALPWIITLLMMTTFLAFLFNSGDYYNLSRWASWDRRWRNLYGFNDHPHGLGNFSVSVYLEKLDQLDAIYGNTFTDLIFQSKENGSPCVLQNGGECVFEADNPFADVVFKNARLISVVNPIRYYPNQILAVMNSEAEATCTKYAVQILRSADLSIDHHTSSAITQTEACGIPWKKELYTTPSPSGRKGVALLMSNCKAKWRNDYIQELLKHIHIHSYGRCFHNTEMKETHDHFGDTYTAIAQNHRMVITFENTIEKDYISEKIGMCFKSGVIPVYWGPPEIYQWVPGEHSFIDPQKFKGPEELAKYLKRVDEDDDLFRYHTTNFTFERARKMHKSYCIASQLSWSCRLCRLAQQIKHFRSRKLEEKMILKH